MSVNSRRNSDIEACVTRKRRTFAATSPSRRCRARPCRKTHHHRQSKPTDCVASVGSVLRRFLRFPTQRRTFAGPGRSVRKSRDPRHATDVGELSMHPTRSILQRTSFACASGFSADFRNREECENWRSMIRLGRLPTKPIRCIHARQSTIVDA